MLFENGERRNALAWRIGEAAYVVSREDDEVIETKRWPEWIDARDESVAS